MRLLAAGYSNREIGEQLYISPTTAASHVAHIFDKLGVNSRSAAVATALDFGLGGRDWAARQLDDWSANGRPLSRPPPPPRIRRQPPPDEDSQPPLV